MHDAKRRLWVVGILCSTSFIGSVAVAFRYPEMTSAQRWLAHPEQMAPTLVLALTALTIAWWPRRDR